MGGDASVKRTVHRPLLTKNAFVGAGALDGPLPDVTNSPGDTPNFKFYCRGVVGAAPYAIHFGLLPCWKTRLHKQSGFFISLL